jgi:predicted kinase
MNETLVHVMTGLPGSGKSSVAREIDAVRFNLDDIRRMLGHGDWDEELEKLARKVMLDGVKDAIDSNLDVVIDNTHLGQRLPNLYRSALSTRPVLFKVHDLTDIPVEKCVDGDSKRSGHERVGENVIRKMWTQHKSLRDTGWRLTDEWMNEWRVPMRLIKPFSIDPDLPWCVIFDIDGTLARHNGRGPYDLERCEGDGLNSPVANALENYHLPDPEIDFEYKVVLLSGRQSEYREHTVRWLDKHEVEYDELYMRPNDDRRPDFVIKSELFEEHIRGRYNVEVVYDDRDQVVDLWRLVYKLPCFQVAAGAF